MHGTVDSAISFLINFCKNNRTNSEELLPFLNNLLVLMRSSAAAPKLVGIMLRHLISQESGVVYIDQVIQLLQSSSSSSQQSSESDKMTQKHALQLLFSFLCNAQQLEFQDNVSYQLRKMPNNRQVSLLILGNQQKIFSKLLQVT